MLPLSSSSGTIDESHLTFGGATAEPSARFRAADTIARDADGASSTRISSVDAHEYDGTAIVVNIF